MARGCYCVPFIARLCRFFTTMNDKVDIGELVNVTNSKKRVGANAEYKFVILKESGLEEAYMFTDKELESGRYRASRNKEDCRPKRSFWQRVFKKRSKRSKQMSPKRSKRSKRSK